MFSQNVSVFRKVCIYKSVSYIFNLFNILNLFQIRWKLDWVSVRDLQSETPLWESSSDKFKAEIPSLGSVTEE